MSSYPMSIRQVSMDHQGGTKSYHLVLIETANNKAIFINRWGKKGQFGEIQVTPFDDVGLATKEFDKKYRSKASGGYRQVTDTTKELDDALALRKELGPVMWPKIGGGAIKHLDPSLDTTGMREPPPPNFNDDGTPGQTRKVDISERLAAEKAAEIERMKTKPNFGRF